MRNELLEKQRSCAAKLKDAEKMMGGYLENLSSLLRNWPQSKLIVRDDGMIEVTNHIPPFISYPEKKEMLLAIKNVNDLRSQVKSLKKKIDEFYYEK